MREGFKENANAKIIGCLAKHTPLLIHWIRIPVMKLSCAETLKASTPRIVLKIEKQRRKRKTNKNKTQVLEGCRYMEMLLFEKHILEQGPRRLQSKKNMLGLARVSSQVVN